MSWPERPKARALHNGITPQLPVKQTLHHRAKKIWTAISEGTAGDIDTFRRLQNIRTNYNKYLTSPFPSSVDLALGPEPPPIYSRSPNFGAPEQEENQILQHIRNTIRDKYLTANPLDPSGIG